MEQCARPQRGTPTGCVSTGRSTIPAGSRQQILSASRKELQEILPHSNPDWALANAYALAGMKEETLRTLLQALQVHDPGLLQIRLDPDFDLIRDDPLYIDLVRRIGLLD